MTQVLANHGRGSAAEFSIDILIPVIEKDLLSLPFVIDMARENVVHPIAEIMVVAPDNDKIREVCNLKGCRFVNENSVLPITKNEIDYRTNEWDRSGWLFQQLLKLSGDAISSSDHYLVLDADTLLIRAHVFKDKEKTVFYCRRAKIPEYFKTYTRLLGVKATAPLSFVARYMLLEKSKLAEMKKAIEYKNNAVWYKAIIKSINKLRPVTFSEFETYGNFVYAKYHDQMIMEMP
ncbi:MAG: DUF6492 family protein [Thermincola sp.]|jgi:hypothetical protein|nr:DUF6492 family protein [Thermincola sp.]MDT3704489.1 DUF6492 family protein [Thermincola sp.]